MAGGRMLKRNAPLVKSVLKLVGAPALLVNGLDVAAVAVDRVGLRTEDLSHYANQAARELGEQEGHEFRHLGEADKEAIEGIVARALSRLDRQRAVGAALRGNTQLAALVTDGAASSELDDIKAEGTARFCRMVIGRVCVLLQAWLRAPDALPRNTFEGRGEILDEVTEFRAETQTEFRDLNEKVDRLNEGVTSLAGRSENPRTRLRESLVRYLTVLVDDVTVDPWPRAHGEPVLSVTDLELTLTVTAGRADGGGGGQDLAADEVADTSRHLVVLGGAGTGKTWLARRIARRAAEVALESLWAGASVEDVEVPLLVTCEQFRTVAGTPRQAAIGPAIDSRSDLGAGVANLLKVHLLERDDGVLTVLDSLDEATTGRRDVDHALIGTWRTVITTRPDAWHGQWDSPPQVHEPEGPSADPARQVTTATLRALSSPTTCGPSPTPGTTAPQAPRCPVRPST